MVQSYRVTRLATTDRSPQTAAGIRVGDSEDTVRRAYGARVKSTPHTVIEAPGAYLTALQEGDGSNDASRGLQFLTDAQRSVRAILARGPSVANVKGCV